MFDLSATIWGTWPPVCYWGNCFEWLHVPALDWGTVVQCTLRTDYDWGSVVHYDGKCCAGLMIGELLYMTTFLWWGHCCSWTGTLLLCLLVCDCGTTVHKSNLFNGRILRPLDGYAKVHYFYWVSVTLCFIKIYLQDIMSLTLILILW